MLRVSRIRRHRGYRRKTLKRGRATNSLEAQVGSVRLQAPVMTAAGTVGRSDELAPYGPISRLGAMVVKSLNADGWRGHPSPRIAVAGSAMINSVGMPGPGVPRWLEDEMPALTSTGATVVVSIWGQSVDEYHRAAELLASAPPQVVAVEVNLSCPNKVGSSRMFSHSRRDIRDVMRATEDCGRPRWAKLSPTTPDLPSAAAAAADGGADAVVLVNTMAGMVIDIETRRPHLGGKVGGVSGAALHPVAVRAVYDVHAACPDLPIVGVGGVACGADAVELIMAGASAVQVGTAIFDDPRAPWRILDELVKWCSRAGVTELDKLVGVAHG